MLLVNKLIHLQKTYQSLQLLKLHDLEPRDKLIKLCFHFPKTYVSSGKRSNLGKLKKKIKKNF